MFAVCGLKHEDGVVTNARTSSTGMLMNSGKSSGSSSSIKLLAIQTFIVRFWAERLMKMEILLINWFH